MNPIFGRILIFIISFVSVVTLPWWISILILVATTIYYPTYFELLFFGFLFDVLYSVKYTFPYTGLLIATVFLLVVMFVKTRIRT